MNRLSVLDVSVSVCMRACVCVCDMTYATEVKMNRLSIRMDYASVCVRVNVLFKKKFFF